MYNYIGLEPRREAMHWQFGEMKFGEMKRNTSNWSNFGMLLRRAGLTASAGLSCCHCQPPSLLLGVVLTMTAYTTVSTTVAVLVHLDTSSAPVAYIFSEVFYRCKLEPAARQ